NYATVLEAPLAVTGARENRARFAVLASSCYPFREDPMPTEEQVYEALSHVLDPEIGKPITELDMVRAVDIRDGLVIVDVLLTVPGCPLKDRITREVTEAVAPLEGV